MQGVWEEYLSRTYLLQNKQQSVWKKKKDLLMELFES